MTPYINPGGMLRCYECDGFATGIVDHNNDGFVRCPTCTMNMNLRYSWDTMPPRNAQTGRLIGDASKGMHVHVDSFNAYLIRCVADKLIRQDSYYLAFPDARRYIYSEARNRVHV